MKKILDFIKTKLTRKKPEPIGALLEELAMRSLRQDGQVIHAEFDGFHVAVKMEHI